MSIFTDLNEIVRACYPKDQEEALELWHDIKPVRFYLDIDWTIAQEYVLARFTIPDDASYFVVTKVRTWIVTNVATAAGFGQFNAPPPATLFRARWRATQETAPNNDFNVTGSELPTALLNVDEFLFFKGGNIIFLLADLPANPTADARVIQTVVYGYILGTKVADKIGSGEIIICNF